MRRRVTTLESGYTVEAVALSTVGHMLMAGVVVAYTYWMKPPLEIPEITYEFISQQQSLAALGPLEAAKLEPSDQAETVPKPAAAAVDPAEPQSVAGPPPESPDIPVETAVLQPPESLQSPPAEAVDLPPPPVAPEPPRTEPGEIQRAQPVAEPPLETAEIVAPLPESLTPLVEQAEVVPPSQAEAVVIEAAPAEAQDVVVPAETPLIEREAVAPVEPDILQPEAARPPETAEVIPPEPELVDPAELVEVIEPPDQAAAVAEEPPETVEEIEPDRGPLPAIPLAKPKDIPKIDPVPSAPAPEPETATEKLFSTIDGILVQAKNPPSPLPSRAPSPGHRRMDPVERRALNKHLKKNFAIDCGTKHLEQYTAVINVRLLPSGRIQTWEYTEETERLARTNASGRRFVEAARRAVLRAAPFPYDILKPETYEHWKEMELVFKLGDLCD